MSEMIERVAAAMAGVAHTEYDSVTNWDEIARAAFVAMREPTVAMLRASPVVGTGPNEHGDWAVNTKPAQAVWPAMIDAALAEP